MRILMFGRGTIATIYGRVLQSAGHEVEFYVRPGRAVDYRGDVRMDLIDARRKARGQRVQESFQTAVRESISPEDGFDLIVLSVGHHRLAEAVEFLAPRIGGATVLVFGNIWEEPLAAIAPLPADQVIFGFPMAGGGYGVDGILHGALFRSITIGMTSMPLSTRELDVRAAFRQAGLGINEEKDMRGWLWLHFISDAGMFAQAIQTGSMPAMIGNGRAFREAFLRTRELLPVLEARGIDLRQHRAALMQYRFPRLIGTTAAWATTKFPIARVSLAAHTDPHAPEPRAVLNDTLRTARNLKIPTPRLQQ